MRLFLLGATGRTGEQVIDLALARGYEVTAYVRTPGKVRRVHERLRVVAGQVVDVPGLNRALAGHDAVVSALGPSPRHAVRGTTLLQEAAAATVAAMRGAEVGRIAVVSSALLFEGGGPAVRLARRLIAPHL